MSPDELKELVRKAYRDKNIKPKNRGWGVTVHPDGGVFRGVFHVAEDPAPEVVLCCALGVLLLGEQTPKWWKEEPAYRFESSVHRMIAGMTGITARAANGFMRGFDSGRDPSASINMGDPYYVAGKELAVEFGL